MSWCSHGDMKPAGRGRVGQRCYGSWNRSPPTTNIPTSAPWGSVHFLSALTQMGSEPFKLVDRLITIGTTMASDGENIDSLLMQAPESLSHVYYIQLKLHNALNHCKPPHCHQRKPPTPSRSTELLLFLSLHHANNQANHAAECSHLAWLPRPPLSQGYESVWNVDGCRESPGHPVGGPCKGVK